MGRCGRPLASVGRSATRAAAKCTLWTSRAHVDHQIPADTEHIYAIMDNLEMHHCRDLLLFMIHHPRWEFVYQPTYAAYLNLIEPWWKVLRSLALKGRRFETWQQVVEAVEAATAYWNAHKHPFVWGRRRRHQPSRCSQKFTFKVKVLCI
jgi:transposase